MHCCGFSRVWVTQNEKLPSCDLCRGLTFTNSSITGSFSAFTPFCGTDSDIMGATIWSFTKKNNNESFFSCYHARLSSVHHSFFRTEAQQALFPGARSTKVCLAKRPKRQRCPPDTIASVSLQKSNPAEPLKHRRTARLFLLGEEWWGGRLEEATGIFKAVMSSERKHTKMWEGSERGVFWLGGWGWPED